MGSEDQHLCIRAGLLAHRLSCSSSSALSGSDFAPLSPYQSGTSLHHRHSAPLGMIFGQLPAEMALLIC